MRLLKSYSSRARSGLHSGLYILTVGIRVSKHGNRGDKRECQELSLWP